MLSDGIRDMVQRGGFSALQDLGSRLDIDGGESAEMMRAKYDDAMENYAMAKMIHGVFSSGNGPEVLEFYRKRTLGRVQFDPEAINPAFSGFFRSGEANIVLHILRGMATAEKGPPEMPEMLREPGENSDA